MHEAAPVACASKRIGYCTITTEFTRERKLAKEQAKNEPNANNIENNELSAVPFSTFLDSFGHKFCTKYPHFGTKQHCTQGWRRVVARLRDKLFVVYNFQIRFQNSGFCSL